MYKLYWSTPLFADLAAGSTEHLMLWHFKKFVETAQPFDVSSAYAALFRDPNNVRTFFLGREKNSGVELTKFLNSRVSNLQIIVQRSHLERDIAFGAANIKKLVKIGFCRCITQMEKKIKAQHRNMDAALDLGFVVPSD